MLGKPYIVLKNIQKGYKIGGEKLTIFDNLNLTIKEGDYVAIMGPSGSGKSTLLNMLAGIDTCDDGELHIGAQRLDHMGEANRTAWRARNMGIVFQFYNLLPMLTAEENIELPLLLKPLSKKERHTRVNKVLSLVGLEGRNKQLPSKMSGGQQQRVGIARALVSNPKLLLCDEPTGDLDRESADDILKILSFLNDELGKTIVMVTHDPQAAHMAKRELHLDKGQFVEQQLRAAE